MTEQQKAEEIVLACREDLGRILEIYDIAKKYMRANGNMLQWNGAYPDEATLLEDMEKNRLYIYKANGRIHGVFVLLMEEEPTYCYIEGGAWLNEEPYGTIHRIASSGEIPGIFGKSVDFCLKKIDNVRVDTHHDNHTMQHLAQKYGFHKCGIIYLQNGDPRIAYHYAQSV